MDKLTAIKIKYDDGTYSDEIPVSVLSENVEWDSTHTLVDILGSVDVDVTGTIQDQISQLFNEKIGASELNSYVASQLNIDVTNWLNKNVNPVGSAVVVDKSLSIEDAAADAKKTGDEISVLKEELTNATEESPIDFFARDIFSLFINGANHSVIFTKGDGIVTANGTATGGNASRGFLNPSNGFMPLPSWIIPGEVLRIKVATSNRNLRFCIAFFDSDNNRIGAINYLIYDRNITVPSNTVAVSMYLHVPESATVSDASISIGIYRSIFALESMAEIVEDIPMNAKIYSIGNSILTGSVWTNGAYNHLSAYENAPYARIAKSLGIKKSDVTHTLKSDTGLLYNAGNGNFLTTIKSTDLTAYDYVLTHLWWVDLSSAISTGIGNISSRADDGTVAGAVISLANYCSANSSQLILIGIPPTGATGSDWGSDVFNHEYDRGTIKETDAVMHVLADKYHFVFVDWESLDISYKWKTYTDNNNVHFNSENPYRIVGDYLGRQICGQEYQTGFVDLKDATAESPIDFFVDRYIDLYAPITNNGITFASIGDGGFSAQGTASAIAYRSIYRKANLPSWMKPGEPLRIYVTTTSTSGLRFVLGFYDANDALIGPWQYISSDRTYTVPTDAVKVSANIQVPSGTVFNTAQTIYIKIYRSIYDLQSLEEFRTTDNDKGYRIGRLSTPDTVDGYVFLDPADWEIGGFNYSFNDYTITYGTNPKRIRTKENFGYPVRAGDVIGMYDYTGFYIYIVIKDATTGVFRGVGARTSDYKVPFDGYAYIYVAKVSDEVYINNVYDYLSKVFIRQASSVISDYKSTTASGQKFVLSHQYGTPVFVPAETKNIIVCGKNIFRTPHGLTTINSQNVTKTFDEKTGTIVVSSEGASTSSVAPDVYSNVNGVSWNCLYKFKLPAAMDVVFSANADKDLYMYGDICMHISDGTKTINAYNEPIVFKAEANKEYGIRIYTSASYSGTVTFRPQVEVNKTYPTEFEPFKGVIVDDNGSVTNINTLSDSLDNGVLIDSYTATVISYDDAVTVNYESVRDKDYGYMLYNLNNKKPDYRQPMISFIDDDTSNTTFVENYYNVMHDIGVVGNFAAVTKKISESDALKTMLLGYEADGFGVLLHCYNQASASTDYFRPKPTDRDINQVRDNMMTGLRAINEFGFISKDYWVTPYGVNDPDIKAVAKSLGLKAVISTLNNTPNIHGVTDRYSIGRYSFSATESSINENLPCIKRGMDACIANGGWIIVTTHANEWGDAVEAVSDALSEIVTYANTIGMKVVNFQEGFETYFG